MLLIDIESNAISKTLTVKSKTVQEFDEKIKDMSRDKCFIAILQKNLFRSNCHNEPQGTPRHNAYCKLIGFAYSKKMLVKAKVENLEGKEFYTYIIDGKPQTAGYDEDLAKKYAYAKSTLMGQDKKLFCIAWDLLKYNDQNKSRMDQSLLATGFFIVQQCQLFKDMHSANIEDFGVRLLDP